MVVLMCVDCVLASPRIAQDDPGRQTPAFLRWFCHSGGGRGGEGAMGEQGGEKGS
jgi:hypothetical protein